MSDIDSAKYYAKRRIEQEDAMSKELLKAYLYAFSRAIKLTASSGVSPSYFAFSRNLQLDAKVDKVMDKLVADLYAIIEKYSFKNMELAKAKNDREDEVDIVGYINRPIKGLDLNGRLAGYSDNAKLEFEAFIGAGLILSKPVNAVISEFGAYFSNPYGSPLLREAWSDKAAKIAAIRLLSKGISFGAGKYVSTWNSLDRLGRATTNYGFNFADNAYMGRSGAIGYIAYRGSNYPCQLCDDNRGFHPISDLTLPVHSRCVCYGVPIYA